MTVVEYRDVTKIYNPGLFKKKVLAVDRLNLKINKGEVFGLIGPNGAGKSTTIRLLLGLIRPSTGEIFFSGEPHSTDEVQNKIGYLPENPYLYDYLNLRELLQFCGATSGMSRRQIANRSDELLARLGLSDAVKRPLRSFSKGMLQRAGICFALMHDPEMVILDEPMSGLDPLGRKMVFDLIMELKGRGKTVFFCSHILNDVERLCDRIGILVSGRLVEELSSEAFNREHETKISLGLTDVSDSLIQHLSQIAEVAEVGTNYYVLFSDSRFNDVLQLVSESGAKVHSCNTDKKTLESHFVEVVGGTVK